MGLSYSERRDFVMAARAAQEKGEPLTPFQKVLLGHRLAFGERDNMSPQEAQWLGLKLTFAERERLGLPPTLQDKIRKGEKLSSWQQKIHTLATEKKVPLKDARRLLYANGRRW